MYNSRNNIIKKGGKSILIEQVRTSSAHEYIGRFAPEFTSYFVRFLTFELIFGFKQLRNSAV